MFTNKLCGVLLLMSILSGVQSSPTPTMDNEITTSSMSTTGNLTIRPRSAWHAAAPRDVLPLKVSPVPFVVIHHTYTPSFCDTPTKCEQAMLTMQKMHQIERGWLDIGYTFVIGGDGSVYEGRGWGRDGAHAPRYNDKSVGISFVGDFRFELPSSAMLSAAKKLICRGVEEGHIRPDYVLLGHRQTRVTECPGDALFREISSWPHFRSQAPSNPQDYLAYLAETPSTT